MKKLTIAELQRNLGELSNAIIRGESLILTRNGHDFAKITPISKLESTEKKTYRIFMKSHAEASDYEDICLATSLDDAADTFLNKMNRHEGADFSKNDIIDFIEEEGV